MARMAEKIAGALAAEIAERTDWDEAPGLYFLYLKGGVPRLGQLPLSDAIWAQDRPPQVLDWVSRSLGDFSGLLQAVAPEGLHGAAFRTEVWTVKEPPPGTAERSEVQADYWAHRLHLRPDRVEARSMWAVDRAGIVYGAVQRRDIDTAPLTQVSYPGPGTRLTGTIPEALERIVTAILAVSLP